MAKTSEKIWWDCYTVRAKASFMTVITAGLNIKIAGGLTVNVTGGATVTLTGSLAFNVSVSADCLFSFGYLRSNTNEFITNSIEYDQATDALKKGKDAISSAAHDTTAVMQYASNVGDYHSLLNKSTRVVGTLKVVSNVHNQIIDGYTKITENAKTQINNYRLISSQQLSLLAAVHELQARIKSLNGGKIVNNAGSGTRTAQTITTAGQTTV